VNDPENVGAARVRRQLTPGPISSSPGTAGLPPFISFSISYPELDLMVTGTDGKDLGLLHLSVARH
jgi:hypothetical protein